MRFNTMAFFLASLSGTMANAGFLQPANFPTSSADLSFVDRLALANSGYEQFESRYDANGDCISGCSYAAPKWEDELAAMARWDALVRKNLKEKHEFVENPDGSLTPPVDKPIDKSVDNPANNTVENKPPVRPPVEQPKSNSERSYSFVQNYTDKNSSFKNYGFPYGNPLGHKACITSYYGPRNLFGRTFHYGMDFAAVSGTPVYAPADGVVTLVFVMNKTCGNGLVIEHSDGYSTKYCHFESVAVKKDDKVVAGGLIGKSDNTGQTTGPHLHYAVLFQGKPVDPINFIEPGHQSCKKKK